MPYIDKEMRLALLNKSISELATISLTPGEINFLISTLLWSKFKYSQRYEMANTLIGVLEAVKLELYRRQIAPYEDNKILDNGDLELI